ncbi:MAG: ribosome maturation factor RimM [Gemmatimonadota bacterium]
MSDIVVGRVRGAHGLGGELRVEKRTDHPDEVFVEGRVLRVLEGRWGGVPDRLTIVSARVHGKGLLVRFAGVEDRGAAERLTGRHLAVPREELPELGEGEFFLHELVGCEIRLADGGPVGRVEAVYDAAGTPLLGVVVAGRERLVPFREGVVRDVRTKERRIVIDPPPGLLEV